MNEKERIERLEEVIAQFLKPVKGIPFNVVVRSLCQHQVIKIEQQKVEDKELIASIVACAGLVGKDVSANPIKRPRPNEVGNDIEAYIMRALTSVGLKCSRPLSAGGRGQGVGYPDILIEDRYGRPTYLEAKIYNQDTADSTMRSFYLSPSDNFKVSRDARHLLLAFEMVRKPLANANLSAFTAVAFKLVDLHDLEIDVKYEFQSDNRRLYSTGALLASGRF